MMPSLFSGLPNLSNGRMTASWPGSGGDEVAVGSRRFSEQHKSWGGVPMDVIFHLGLSTG